MSIWLQNADEVCILAALAHADGYVWCLRVRSCGLWAKDFWESRLETIAEHWGH